MSQVMDVIVIGCGASGVAALRRLHDAGLKVLGLEAGDRIGGRINSVPIGDKFLDIGAAWCHGEKDNIVYELANPLGLLGRPEGPETKFIIYNGRSQRRVEDILNVLHNAIDGADKDTKMSISEFLRTAVNASQEFSEDPKLMNAVIEWYERNNHVGGQIDPSTGKSLKGMEEHWPCEGEFWLNWKGKGYKTILDVLLKKYPNLTEEIPVNILLNKEVESIKWRSAVDQPNPLVQVRCKDGSLYAAKCIIVTVSLGVLKERHTNLFHPALPADKVNTIENLHLSVLDKIYIEFERPWWPASRANFIILWRKEDKAQFEKNESWVTEIHGLQTVEHQPSLLLAWIYGHGAEQMEKVNEEDVKRGVKKLMDTMLSQYKPTKIKRIIRSQWATNPLARGAYSYRSVASEENGASASILSEPLYHEDVPVVCFAGEATSHHHHNSVHGAVEAGFREADRLINFLK